MCIVWINFLNFKIFKNLKSKTFYIPDIIWDILFKVFIYIWKKKVYSTVEEEVFHNFN